MLRGGLLPQQVSIYFKNITEIIAVICKVPPLNISKHKQLEVKTT